MPELPEVETTVRGLARFLDGEEITHIRTNRPDMRRPFPKDLAQALTGARVTGLGRRAKYGLIHTSRETTLVFHLGMSGKWRINPATSDKHDHLIIETARDRFALNDPRRFGWVDIVPRDQLETWDSFAKIGPEPLSDALNARYLASALQGRNQTMKQMLLDQRIIAGLGNIYVCEALWRAGIAPTKRAGRVSKAALENLITHIKAVLDEAIAKGGSTLKDYAAPDGNLGYFAAEFSVYGREGQPCKNGDGAAIQRISQNGRSTWFCPQCQK